MEEKLKKTAEWCIEARQVLFTGMGASGSLAGYGSRLLSDIGITSFVITDPFHPMPARNMEDTVLIAISTSGEKSELISMVDGYKKRHIKIVSITNTNQCTLAKMSDINFAYYMPLFYSWPPKNVPEMTTQIPPVYILETLMCKIYPKIGRIMP